MPRGHKSIRQMLHLKINDKLRIGESKHQAKIDAREKYKSENNGSLKGYTDSIGLGIHSIKTTEAYRQTADEFSKWLKEQGVKNGKDLSVVTRQHMTDYLRERQADGKSAWTCSKDMAALNKIFEARLTKAEVGLNQRHMADIRKGHEQVDRVDLKAYKDHVLIAQATGMRKQSVTTVKPSDFKRDNKGQVVSVKLTEKGGRERISPILESKQSEVTTIINNATNGDNPLFAYYDPNINNHAFRAEYAKELYQQEYDKLTSHDRELYKGYDKQIIQEVSWALGHNRLSVVVDHYMR